MKDYPYTRIVVDERACPAEDGLVFQPYLPGAPNTLTALSLSRLEVGKGCDGMGRESMALALSQVTAANILPPLVDLPTGVDLLNYRVNLGDQLDPILVRELALILENNWCEMGWQQLSQHRFVCVIGAGAAACIETARGEEQLFLRYASDLANELFHAGRAIDLPRSRLFLQTTLHEKVNALLARLREHCWDWVDR